MPKVCHTYEVPETEIHCWGIMYVDYGTRDTSLLSPALPFVLY